MKPLAALLTTLSLVAGLTAAEPLYVPSGSPTYLQTPIPESQPLPQSLGSSAVVPGGPVYSAPLAQPTPMYSQPMPSPSMGGMIPGKLVNLYPNVRVVSPHLKHPHGITQVVEVPNPFPRSGRCDPVYVQICVPPGCQPFVTTGPRGQRITYAFGGYRVQVTSLRGVVRVDYDRI